MGQINNLLCDFGKLDVVTKNKLFLSYCSSHYGAELWNLECEDLESYGAVWRTGLRRIWGLPFNSHGNIVSLISSTVPITSILAQRFVNFVYKCLNCSSDLIHFIVRHSMLDVQMHSIIVCNIFSCAKYFQCNQNALLSCRLSGDKLRHWFHQNTTYDDIVLARAALECIFVRDKVYMLDNFLSDEVNFLLAYFTTCTSCTSL